MEKLGRKQATLKTGYEKLINNGKVLAFSLADFWGWSVSDILSNATRGRYAEFIVATATNIDIKQIREEWSPYDLETVDGIKIEVKSAAYLQSWHQEALSYISFKTRATLAWDSQTNLQASIEKRKADIYVFCLLRHENKLTVDPLILNQWEFYVLSTEELNKYPRSQHSITLKSLQGLTKAIEYEQLNEEIRTKYIKNKEM